MSLILSPKSNVGIGYRTQVICNKMLELHEKWKAAQDRGTSLCNSIEKIKSAVLADRENAKTLFPQNLLDFCKKLEIITTIFEDIVEYTKESLDQLKALEHLNAPDFAAVTRTWSSRDYVEFVEKILQLYEEEYKIKLIVKGEFFFAHSSSSDHSSDQKSIELITENIGYSKTKPELVFHTSAWLFPCYANRNLDLLFKTLALESSWYAS